MPSMQKWLHSRPAGPQLASRVSATGASVVAAAVCINRMLDQNQTVREWSALVAILEHRFVDALNNGRGPCKTRRSM